MSVCSWVLAGAMFAALPHALAEGNRGPVHGLWVWKTPAILESPGGAEALQDFCRTQNINEVYWSFSGAFPGDERVANLIALLHPSGIRVEALLSATGEKLLDETRAVVRFNQTHPKERFDGIHLDVEPQQLPENKGASNLRFLPALVATYREVRDLAASGMTVNADIAIKFLKGDLHQRRMLLSALPRLTLMLYELNSPSEKLPQASERILDLAYQGLSGADLAQIAIGLRSPDYGESLPAMLRSLDTTLVGNPHYLGWAWHSYNGAAR